METIHIHIAYSSNILLLMNNNMYINYLFEKRKVVIILYSDVIHIQGLLRNPWELSTSSSRLELSKNSILNIFRILFPVNLLNPLVIDDSMYIIKNSQDNMIDIIVSRGVII